MDKELIIEYAPAIIVVLMFFINNRIFVTPAQLLEMKETILKEVEDKFATAESMKDLKEDFKEVKQKIDKIYDILISRKKEVL